jgi:hypothetical protein
MIEELYEPIVARDRDYMQECLARAVESIRRGRDYEAVSYLQRAFTGDTATQELIENAWRRK